MKNRIGGGKSVNTVFCMCIYLQFILSIGWYVGWAPPTAAWTIHITNKDEAAGLEENLQAQHKKDEAIGVDDDGLGFRDRIMSSLGYVLGGGSAQYTICYHQNGF
jgi:hypothetical protein